MKKIEWILAIIIPLLDHQLLMTTELAKRFEVSKRTIFRDMETIEQAGFPISSLPGRQGGFLLIDSIKLHSLTYTEEEKKKVLTALKLQENLIGTQQTQSGIKEKISLLLQDPTTLATTVSIDSPTVHRAIVEKAVYKKNSLIESALSQNLKVKIQYIDGNGQFTTRIVLPHELILFNGSWFMYAFCESRQDFRFFKVTRIRQLEILTESFMPFTDLTKKWPAINQQTVKLQFPRESLGRLYDYYTDKEIDVTDDHVIVTFLSTSLSKVARYLLGFGSNVSILEPKDLVEEHQRLIKELSTLYKS